MRNDIVSAMLISTLLGVPVPACSESLAITPFRTTNRSPLVQIFGLPEPESSRIAGQGKASAALLVDIANNYAVESRVREELVLDGEVYRTTLACRYGFGNRLEAGIDIPVISNTGGTFDGFIEGWHDFFGLPQGSRTEAPRNRILYSYSKDGKEQLRLDRSDTGIGDIRLSAGYQLLQPEKPDSFTMALRGSIKLPSGNSSMLQGSGSFDTALWVDASNSFTTSIGNGSLFGSSGGMVMTKGDVLPDQQRSFAGFAAIGAGLAPADWIAFMLQFSGHSPFYTSSSLDELSAFTLQIHTGGTLRLPGSLLLDIAISEDLAVHTAPDATLHMALRKSF